MHKWEKAEQKNFNCKIVKKTPANNTLVALEANLRLLFTKHNEANIAKKVEI